MKWITFTALVRHGQHRSIIYFEEKKKTMNKLNTILIQVKRDALIGEAEARKESTIGDLSFKFTFKNV